METVSFSTSLDLEEALVHLDHTELLELLVGYTLKLLEGRVAHFGSTSRSTGVQLVLSGVQPAFSWRSQSFNLAHAGCFDANRSTYFLSSYVYRTGFYGGYSPGSTALALDWSVPFDGCSGSLGGCSDELGARAHAGPCLSTDWSTLVHWLIMLVH